MSKLILLLTIIFSGCSSVPKYSQSRLKSEGKDVWLVEANLIPCKSNFKECKDGVKREIDARGKKVCRNQVFRVLKCDYQPSSYKTIQASCKIHCGERPTPKDAADSSSAPESEHTRKQKSPKSEDDSKPFDWTDP